LVPQQGICALAQKSDISGIGHGTATEQALTQRRKAVTARRQRQRPARPTRERVLSAAFATFRDRGFSGASTLEIATRAKASKRELYTLFDDKQAMLVACIVARAERMRAPLQLPTPQNRDELKANLAARGTALIRGTCDPDVLAVYRIAIAESEAAPAIARTLDTAGRQTNRGAVVKMVEEMQARGIVRAGDPAAMAELFFGALWGDLLLRLLLRVTEAPSAKEAERRARAAAELFLSVHALA
jgi:AcrR family transcriptional regulator